MKKKKKESHRRKSVQKQTLIDSVIPVQQENPATGPIARVI